MHRATVIALSISTKRGNLATTYFDLWTGHRLTGSADTQATMRQRAKGRGGAALLHVKMTEVERTVAAQRQAEERAEELRLENDIALAIARTHRSSVPIIPPSHDSPGNVATAPGTVTPEQYLRRMRELASGR